MMKSLVAVCLLACCSRAIHAQDPLAIQPPIDLKELHANVERAESSFQNLYIKNFRTTVQTRVPDEREWKQTPIVFAGSAWYDGSPRGRARVYYAEHVMEWMNGFAPWSAAILDEGWDGLTGTELHVAGGTPGHLHRDRDAMLTPEPPAVLGPYSRYETGAAYSLQYFVQTEDMARPPIHRNPLSNLLRDPAELTREVINNVNAVRIRWTYPNNQGSLTYWLDPARGYALVKHEQIANLAGGIRTDTIDVHDLKQIAAGIWFPLRATNIHRMPGPGGYWRYEYQADDAVANDQNFDPAIFTAAIPDGFMVTDTRGGSDRPRSYFLRNGTQEPLVSGQSVPEVLGEAKRPDAAAIKQ